MAARAVCNKNHDTRKAEDTNVYNVFSVDIPNTHPNFKCLPLIFNIFGNWCFGCACVISSAFSCDHCHYF